MQPAVLNAVMLPGYHRIELAHCLTFGFGCVVAIPSYFIQLLLRLECIVHALLGCGGKRLRVWRRFVIPLQRALDDLSHAQCLKTVSIHLGVRPKTISMDIQRYPKISQDIP